MPADPRYVDSRKGRPVRLNRHESRMVHRGRESGFRSARYQGHLARLYPADPCPYPDEGRPRELWLEGEKIGRKEGLAELREVRESFQAALAALDQSAVAAGG